MLCGGGCLLRHVPPVSSGRHCAARRDSLRIGNAVNNPIQEKVGVLFGLQALFLYSFTRITIFNRILLMFEYLLAYYLYEQTFNIFKYLSFRKQKNEHDNNYQDKALDSIINYETVKYFTGEEFEINRFKVSVIKYFRVYSHIQLSRGLLNIIQQVL